MFEWCFRSRYTTAGFGVVVAASMASFTGLLGAGPFAVVAGIAVGMPVLVAGSPTLAGERYLGATSPGERALSAVLTVVVALLVGLVVAAPAAELLGTEVAALLGAVAAVVGGQVAFFARNQEYVDQE